MAGYEPTRQQERVAMEIRRAIPGVEIDVDMIGPNAWITFAYDDPRPSRNQLISDSCGGFVCVGPRGGIHQYSGSGYSVGRIRHEGKGAGSKTAIGFHVMLEMLGSRHPYYA